MNVEINAQAMRAVMEDFYISTGITIVFFGPEDTSPMLSVPRDAGCFCAQMKQHEVSGRLCRESDAEAMRICREKNCFTIYRCHAGLTEACAPLEIDGETAGYFMFGQVSETEDAEDLEEKLRSYAAGLGISLEGDITADIQHRNVSQVRAAARIMDALARYSVEQDAVRTRRHNFVRNMTDFLENHLSEDLSSERIAKELGISRTKLYDSCSEYLGRGIAAYVTELRMERARGLLKNTEKSIQEIGSECGYWDYNYFCRVFRRENGISAVQYRKRCAE